MPMKKESIGFKILTWLACAFLLLNALYFVGIILLLIIGMIGVIFFPIERPHV